MNPIQKIKDFINRFDFKFLKQNEIAVIGGAAITINTNLFRQSDDVDLGCLRSEGFKALYRLLQDDINNIKPILGLSDDISIEFSNIKMNRGAIRFIMQQGNEKPQKIEIIDIEQLSDFYNLNADNIDNIYQLDTYSLFFTKLAALTERHQEYPYKDIIDFLNLTHTHGVPSSYFLTKILNYNKNAFNVLFNATSDIVINPNKYYRASKDLNMNECDSEMLFEDTTLKIIEFLYNNHYEIIECSAEWLKSELMDLKDNYSLNETQEKLFQLIYNHQQPKPKI